MTITIKHLMEIEEVLLKAENDFKYSLSMDELIKIEKYIKEIGELTNIFFSAQVGYSKILNPYDEEYEHKLSDYRDKLISCELDDVEVEKYATFIFKSVLNKITDEEYLNKAKKILTLTK